MVANAICARQSLDIAKGLRYLHSLDIPYGDLSGVGYPSDRSGCIPTACFVCHTFGPRAHNLLVLWPHFTGECSRGWI